MGNLQNLKTQLRRSPFYCVEFKLVLEEFLVHMVVKSKRETS